MILVLAHGVFAVPARGNAENYSIGEAIGDAIGVDPRVDFARAETEAAETEIDLARGGYFPSVSAQAGVGDLAGETEYQLNMRQMLYDWGRVSSRVDASEAESLLSREKLRLTHATVAFDTADTYLSYHQSRSVASIFGEYIAELDSLIGIARQRAEGRFSSRVEVDRARLERARAVETRQRYRGWQAAAREDFLEFTGRDPGTLDLQFPPALPVLETYADGNSDLDRHIKTSPRVTTELAEVEKARAEVELAEAELWPQLNLEADWIRREFNEAVDSDLIVALRVRSDTYLGLSNFRRPEAARHRLRARDHEVRTARREIRRSLQQLAAMQPALEARIDALGLQAQNSREITEVYQQQFLAGLRDFDDLLTVIRDGYEARRQQVELEAELLRQQYQVAADFGVLEAMLTGGADHD